MHGHGGQRCQKNAGERLPQNALKLGCREDAARQGCDECRSDDGASEGVASQLVEVPVGQAGGREAVLQADAVDVLCLLSLFLLIKNNALDVKGFWPCQDPWRARPQQQNPNFHKA